MSVVSHTDSAGQSCEPTSRGQSAAWVASGPLGFCTFFVDGPRGNWDKKKAPVFSLLSQFPCVQQRKAPKTSRRVTRSVPRNMTEDVGRVLAGKSAEDEYQLETLNNANRIFLILPSLVVGSMLFQVPFHF